MTGTADPIVRREVPANSIVRRTVPANSSDGAGFIRVTCPACGNADVWFRCNGCQTSDRFTLADGTVSCACGARYTSGTCTCGASVGPEGLSFVAFDKGPMALARWEIAWERVAALGLVAVFGIGGLAWWVLA